MGRLMNFRRKPAAPEPIEPEPPKHPEGARRFARVMRGLPVKRRPLDQRVTRMVVREMPAAITRPIPDNALRELAAMQQCLAELLVLEDAARERAILWLCEQLFGPDWSGGDA